MSMVSKNKNKTVFVAMSGGVDSSVAAFLLKKQGYNVVGVFMRCVNLDGCAERDSEDARRVAGVLGIPFYVWDFEKQYEKAVVGYMIEGYKLGITPNPDVMCNREVKFGLFLQKALSFGADYIATGHYVRRRENNDGTVSLLQANDKNKDQSYFLWTLTQAQLRHALFPIGEYEKPAVRAMAKKALLPTAAKKDSQGICFLGKVSVHDFLNQHIASKPGAVVLTDGTPAGVHEGAWFYTIGQRHGLNISKKKPSVPGQTNAYYVSGVDVKTNTVTVAEGEDNSALYKKEVGVGELNIINPKTSVKKSNQIFARVRYRQPLSPALLRVGGKDKNTSLVFHEAQKFVAIGQSAVFYSKTGEMIGGGVICSAQ